MNKATVYNTKGEKVKELDLNPKIFGLKVNPELVAQAVIVQKANKRNNLANVKDRSAVAGGGKKPWRQKGTGRARHGSIRSPLWRGGGVTFGPSKDNNYSLKINKKAKQKAILMSLSDKAANEKLILVDKMDLEEAKTKKFFEILQNLKLRDKSEKKKATAQKAAAKKDDKKIEKKKKQVKSILVVMPAKDEKVKRASRNIKRVDSIIANSLNVVDVLRSQYLVMPVDSIKEIEKTFVK